VSQKACADAVYAGRSGTAGQARARLSEGDGWVTFRRSFSLAWVVLGRLDGGGGSTE